MSWWVPGVAILGLVVVFVVAMVAGERRKEGAVGRHSWLTDRDVDDEPPIMRYRRDVPRDDHAAIDLELQHVRDHLAAIADGDDNPATHRDAVRVKVLDHLDDDTALVSIVGELDAPPDAPYLLEGYDPDDDPPFVPPGDTQASAWEVAR